MRACKSLRHPIPGYGHLNKWRLLLVFAWLAATVAMGSGAERVATLPQPRAPLLSQQIQPVTQTHGRRKKPSGYAEGFLLKGTAFTDQGFSLANAELRVRRAGDKKYRWTAVTDQRGEFAIRVPKGADYEVSVRARGYDEQTRTVDAKAGEGDEGLIFHMTQGKGGKSK